MKSRAELLLVSTVLAIALITAGCTPQAVSPIETSPTASPAQPLELTDGLGRQVVLTAPAQRIVSLAPSITESLFAIGAGDQVIGRDEFSNYPAEASTLPSVGGYFSDYNYEAIVELDPDLVLAAEINTPEQVKALEDLGLSVYYLSNPTTLEEMYADLQLLAYLTGHETQAAQLIEALKARVQAVQEKLNEVSDHPRVFYELDSTDPDAPYTAGPGTFIDTLISMAGGENVASDLAGQYGQISIEALLLKNPEIILLGDAAYGATPESVAERTGWEALEAVKSQRVYPFDDDLVSRPGPRLVDGLEALAELLHPDRFE